MEDKVLIRLVVLELVLMFLWVVCGWGLGWCNIVISICSQMGKRCGGISWTKTS